MEELKLDVEVRNQIGSRKVKVVRAQDFVPAIIYGDEKEPIPVKVDRRVYERAMRSHRGQSVVFHLNLIDGDKKVRDYSAIVREEQHEPVSDHILHIDFQRISLTKEIEVHVPLVTKGDPIGVKADGGSLEHAFWEVNVICLPTKIPEKIEINVSELKIGDAIHVKDVIFPEGVRTKMDPEVILVSVVPPMKEIKAPVEGEKPPEPEVLKEKKAEPAEGKPEEKGSEKKSEKKAE